MRLIIYPVNGDNLLKYKQNDIKEVGDIVNVKKEQQTHHHGLFNRLRH